MWRRFLLLFVSSTVLLPEILIAQDISQDVSNLSIRVLVPERELLTSDACRQLETRMTLILTENGVVNDIPSNRFVMTAKANVLNKDIIAGLPSRVSEQIELTFIIGDILDNKKYGTYVLNLTGVGLNENKALLMALKSIRAKDGGIAKFIETSKAKIVQFYMDNEERILNEADKKMSSGHYDEALYYLSLIPDACGSCFNHCQNKMLEIIQQKINFDGQSLLNEANAVWAASPNARGASEAYPLIAAIDSRADCFPEVKKLLKTISTKLVADDKREWDFKMKQYDDEIAKEQRDFEFEVQKYQDDLARDQRDFDAKQAADARAAIIRQQEINAARDVAIEYAKNLPDVVESNNIILW